MNFINQILQKKALIALILIVISGFLLRIYKVDTSRQLLIDEVSIGYNAWSILETGKDEHGVFLPLDFKAFGDHKLPAIIYLTIPFIQLFGLTNFGIRITSVVIGTISILAVYWLFRNLNFSKNQSLVAAAIAATSPWTIMLSRFSRESNVALLFFIIGFAFFLKYIKSKRFLFLVCSTIFTGLTWYSYLPYRLVTTIFYLFFILFLLYKKKMNLRNILSFFILSLIIIAPLIPILSSPSNTARLRQASIFNNDVITIQIDQERIECIKSVPQKVCYLNSNKLSAYTIQFINNYAQVYSLDFLFLQAEDLKHTSVVNYGVLPFILIPFYLLGLFYFFKVDKEYGLIIIAGALIAGIPSSLADGPQTIRLSSLFVFLLIVTMYGWKFTIKNKDKITWTIAIIASLFIFGIHFLFNYLFIHVSLYEKNQSIEKNVMSYLNQVSPGTQVYLGNIGFNEPIVYYAYFNKVHPSTYQKERVLGELEENGFQHTIEFRNIKDTDTALHEIMCRDNISARQIYITKDKYFNNNVIKPINILYSDDKTNELLYIYDISSSNKTKSICHEYYPSLNPEK